MQPTLPFPHGVHKPVLHACASIPALQISSPVPFTRFLIYAFIYDICLSLSDFHFVQQTLGPSVSLGLKHKKFDQKTEDGTCMYGGI